MAKKPKVLARDQYEVIATAFSIPQSFVRQVIVRLKSDRRIEATRPVVTPMTPQSLARIILGLAAPLPSRATEIERRMGKLPLFTAEGADTVEAELADIIAGAASSTGSDTDFRAGDILIGVTSGFVSFSLKKFGAEPTQRTYRNPAASRENGMATIVQVPLQAVRQVALDLIGN